MYVVGIRWNLTFHEMPRHFVACRQCLKYSQKYTSYSKCLKILGISWNARQRPGNYCNLAKIVRIQPLPRHYMECQITDGHFLQRRGKSCKFAPFAPFSPSIATTTCYARAVRNCACMGGGCKPHIGLREAFREQSMLGGQGMRQCASLVWGELVEMSWNWNLLLNLLKKVPGVVRVQMQNKALLKGTSTVR